MLKDGTVDTEQKANELLKLDPLKPLPIGFFPEDDEGESNLTQEERDVLNAAARAEKERNRVYVPIGQHENFAIFFKMVQMGLPVDAIKEKMARAGLDSSVLDRKPDEMVPLDLAASLQFGTGRAVGASGAGFMPPNGTRWNTGGANMPAFAFFGSSGNFPPGATGFPPEFYPGGPGEGVPGEGGGMYYRYPYPGGHMLDGVSGAPTSEQAQQRLKGVVSLSEHPMYERFFRMQSVGMPKDDIKAHMRAAGVDPDMLDKDPATLVSLLDPTGTGKGLETNPEPNALNDAGEKDQKEMVKLSEHPKYSKFFKVNLQCYHDIFHSVLDAGVFCHYRIILSVIFVIFRFLNLVFKFIQD